MIGTYQGNQGAKQMTKIYQYAEYPTSYLNFGCSCYKYSEVKDFVKPECLSLFNEQFNHYYIPCSYVDTDAYLEHCELMGAIEEAGEAPLSIRIKEGHRWAGLHGELIGDKVNVQFSSNQYALHSIDIKNLILA